jgi:DNA-binding transcriptional LysR family regulator
MNLVPLAVASMKRQHPKVLVRIDIDNSDALVRSLLKGELDVIVGRMPVSHVADELHFEALAHETHCVIARSAHPLARKRRLELRDVVDHPWILPPVGSMLRDRLDSVFVRCGLRPPRNVTETASVPVIASMLEGTDMISALQEETVHAHCKAGLLTVLPLRLALEMQPFGIVTRREHRISPAAEVMLASLRATALQMYRDEMPQATKRRTRRASPQQSSERSSGRAPRSSAALPPRSGRTP